MKTGQKIGVSVLILVCIAIVLGLGSFVIREFSLNAVNIYGSEYSEGNSGDLPIKWKWVIQRDPAFLQVEFISEAQLHGCRGSFDGTEDVRLVPTCRYMRKSTLNCQMPLQLPPYVSNAPNLEYLLVEDADGPARPFEGAHVVRLDCDEGFSEMKFEVIK